MKKLHLIIFILLAVLAIVNSISYCCLEPFSNTTTTIPYKKNRSLIKKTVFLVWRIKRSENNSQGGLGDKIRGAIATHQYCRINNINLIVDATDDNCGDFFKNTNYRGYNNKIKDKDIIIYTNNDYTPRDFYNELDEKLADNNEVYIFSTIFPLHDIDEYDKKFIKNMIEPSDKIKAELNIALNELPKNYGIQHFRFTDDYFSDISEEQTQVFEKCFDLLQQSYKTTDVLITNSNHFKTYVNERIPIKTIRCEGTCNPGHIGDNTTDYESLKYSFIEFYVLTKSKYIKSYTMYGWISGFANWASKIYDIPLENTFIH